MTNPNTAPSAAQPTKESPSPNYRPCKDAPPADYPPPDAALAEFTDYFVRNYPGPDTIITDPKWHAPKLFRAAQRAISRAGLRSGVSADPLPDLHAQIMNIRALPEADWTPSEKACYKIGHRDARHAAAELASQHQVKKGEPS